MKSWRRTGGLAAFVLIALASCCRERPLRVNDMESRLDFGFDWATKVKFDASMRFDFDLDFSAWAKFSAASRFTLDFDFGELPVYRRKLQADLDDDGILEVADLLAFGTDPASPERVFVAWQGDAYTFDADRCYVMWWEGTKVQLLNSQCHSSGPALHCEVTQGKAGTFSCNVCASSGTCAQCSSDEVTACVSDGQSRLDRPPASGNAGASSIGNTGGAGNTGGILGGAGTAGSGAAGAASIPGGGQSSVTAVTGGAPQNVATTIAVSADFDTCLTEVRSLSSAASRCGSGTLSDSNTLCSSHLSDVNVCYLAVQGAGLFGSDCTVLRSDVCQGVFP